MMPGYPTQHPDRLAPSGTVPEGTTELWTDTKRYLRGATEAFARVLGD